MIYSLLRDIAQNEGTGQMEGEAQLFFISEAGGCIAAHFWDSNAFKMHLGYTGGVYTCICSHKQNSMYQCNTTFDVIPLFVLFTLQMCTTSFPFYFCILYSISKHNETFKCQNKGQRFTDQITVFFPTSTGKACLCLH